MSVNHADEVSAISESKITAIPLFVLKNLVDHLDKEIQDKSTLISFEFVIGSLFPIAMKNIENYCTQQYIEGYNSAKEEYNIKE